MKYLPDKTLHNIARHALHAPEKSHLAYQNGVATIHDRKHKGQCNSTVSVYETELGIIYKCVRDLPPTRNLLLDSHRTHKSDAGNGPEHEVVAWGKIER